MEIHSLPFPECYFPVTDFVYMTDLLCGASVELHPFPSNYDPNAIYKWEVLVGENYTLSIPSGTDSHSVQVSFSPNDDGLLRMDAYQYTSYGLSPHPTVEYRIYAGCGRGSSPLKVYPNPVSNILTIDVNALVLLSPVDKNSRSSPSCDVRLYDMQGGLLRQATAKGGTVQFNVSNLPDGIYYLHVYDGVNSTPIMQQVMIER